jgi:murein DD-endopeptidase MepM/ murein hydrolase activator NlpD
VSIQNLSADALAAAAARPASGSATGGSRADVERLAQEFEAIFLLQMVRQMREALLESEETDKGLGAGTMTDTFDVEFARYLSTVGGIGLAASMTGHLPGGRDPAGPDRPPGVANVGTATRGAPHAAPAISARATIPAAAGRAVLDAPPPAVSLPLDASISSGFGWRTDPFAGTPRFHGGVDFKAAYGREVPTAAAGQVVYAGEQGGYGQTVVVEHGAGYRTRYAHLSAITVVSGQRLAEGAVVGRVGQSGRATGPHLHFEVTRDGRRLDPEDVARGWSGALKSTAPRVDSPVDSASTPGLSTGAEHES